jgi:hypothetical protein
MINRRTLLVGAAALVVLAAVAAFRRGPVDARVAGLIEPTQFDYADESMLREEAVDLTDREITQLLSVARKNPVGWFAGRFPAVARTLHEWTDDGSGTGILQTGRMRREMRRQTALRLLSVCSAHRDRVLPELAAIGTTSFGHDARTAAAVLRFSSPSGPGETNRASEAAALADYSLYRAAAFAPSPPMELLPVVLERFGSGNVRDWLLMEATAGLYGAAASNAAPRLRSLIHSPDLRRGYEAACVLGQVAPEAIPEALAVVLAHDQTNKNLGGFNAPRFYRSLGPAGMPAIPVLERVLAETNYSLNTAGAAQALWSIRHEATPRMIEALAADVDHQAAGSRRISLQVLREIGPGASNAIPALERLLHSRWRQNRRLAAETLEAVRGKPPR